MVITENTHSTTNRTTTALNINHGGKNTISGNFSVINTVPLDGRYWEAETITFANNNNAVFVQGGSSLEFSKETESVFIAALNDEVSAIAGAAISAKNTDNSKNKNGDNTVTVQGHTVQIIGNLDVGNNISSTGKNTINLTLSSTNSFWYGNQSGVSDTNTVNLTLENGGEWIYANDRSIQNLTLLNEGVVNLADDEVHEKLTSTVTDSATGQQIDLSKYSFDLIEKHNYVEIQNLKGSGGIFKMDLSFLGNEIDDYFKPKADSDYIEVASSEAGTHTVEFDGAAAKIDELNIGDRIYFAEAADGNVKFKTNHDGVSYRADEPVDFVYGTDSELNGEQTYWYFTRKGNVTGAYQPFMKTAAFASYALAADLDRFNDRRGESRYADGTDNGLWVRYSYGNLDWDNAFDMDKNMIQIGYDRVLGDLYGRHIIGAAVDYTNADIDIPGVSGDNESERYALSLYYTWLTDAGIYTDLVLKGGIIDSDYDVTNAAGAKIGSGIDQSFYGFSLESGWKFDFSNQLFVEPQVQVQYIHLEGDDFTTDGGVKAHLTDIDSFIGRAGARAGYDFSFSRDLPDSSIYVKADVLREFNADRGYYMMGRTTSYDDRYSGSQTWFDAGIGADLSVTENVKLWLDAEHIFGGDYEDSWQLTAGARFEF